MRFDDKLCCLNIENWADLCGPKLIANGDTSVTLVEAREDFSLTCLPVRENAGIVALERVLQNVTPHRIEDYVLWSVVVGIWVRRKEAVIEGEGFWLFSGNSMRLTLKYVSDSFVPACFQTRCDS